MRTPAYDKKIAAVAADFNNSISALAGEVHTNDREHNKKRLALEERIAMLEAKAKWERRVAIGLLVFVGVSYLGIWLLERAR